LRSHDFVLPLVPIEEPPRSATVDRLHAEREDIAANLNCCPPELCDTLGEFPSIFTSFRAPPHQDPHIGAPLPRCSGELYGAVTIERSRAAAAGRSRLEPLIRKSAAKIKVSIPIQKIKFEPSIMDSTTMVLIEFY
jgi:hypothetical protein